MKIKPWIATIVSVFMLTAVIGCSSSQSGGTDSASQAPNKETSKEKVELNFWYGWAGKEGEAMEGLISEFNQSQDRITVKGLTQGDNQKQMAAITGGNPPDLATNDAANVGAWGSKGAMMALEDLISQNKTDLSDFIPAALDAVKYNGKIYALPVAVHVKMLFYNKDLLKEAGYDAPPKTMAELKVMSEKLTQMNGKSLERVAIPPMLDPFATSFAFGGLFWDDQNKQVTSDNEGIKKAFQYVKGMWSKYDSKELDRFSSALGNYASAQNPFFTGKYAMTIDGEWLPTFIKQYAPNLNYGLTPVPYDESDPGLKDAGQLLTTILYIPRGAKHPQEAYEFMQWLLSKESSVKLMSKIGNLPPRKSAADDPALASVPGFKDFLAYLGGPNIKSFPTLPFGNEYMAEVWKQYDSFLRDKVTLDEALQNIKNQIQPLVAKTMK
ncbi:ABC transporter substrate-binding protein [Paenibacillus selenitireducens]|uniref:ABC transporter substrate-binding protein n=1 Tax=Paenibacillus selenitireducens TaxID=1324314 RepID=A0A1T2X3D8_9BACL|nr:ABC transporter substrate-binding protein [Paenibacillus selenitireducens]OPA74236.1 ABC transporter substrate-binding protein [Paenibacillus selenitireducens]